MVNIKPALVSRRRRRSGPRCIRCIRAKKGPCTGGQPTCNGCGAKNLLCVWEDDNEDDGGDELRFVAQEQLASGGLLPAEPSDGADEQIPDGVDSRYPDTVHLEPTLPTAAQTHNLTAAEDDSTYESAEPAPPKRKRGRPSKSKSTCPSPLGPRRYTTKLIHRQLIRYLPTTHTTLVDPDPTHQPGYIDPSTYPSDTPSRYRYPSSPTADFVQPTPLLHNQEPVTLWCPRIVVEVQEVGVGFWEDEWMRLGEGVDGGWMAWPGGRWVQEGERVWRWVK